MPERRRATPENLKPIFASARQPISEGGVYQRDHGRESGFCLDNAIGFLRRINGQGIDTAGMRIAVIQPHIKSLAAQPFILIPKTFLRGEEQAQVDQVRQYEYHAVVLDSQDRVYDMSAAAQLYDDRKYQVVDMAGIPFRDYLYLMQPGITGETQFDSHRDLEMTLYDVGQYLRTGDLDGARANPISVAEFLGERPARRP